MGRIEQLHPGDYEAKPSHLFLSLAYEFTDLKATLPQGKLPLTPADLTVLQNQALHVEQEESLCRIWEKIESNHYHLPALKTAAEIRSWLNNPNNAGIINGITEIDLSSLKLRVLPPEIARFTKLRILSLYNNQLTTLPDAIGSLTALQKLSLYRNQLITLPDAIGALTGLKWLWLSENQLKSLPKEIGALIALEELSLISNYELTTLPEEFGALKKLKRLRLESTGFKTIPDAIADLTGLEEFKFNRQIEGFTRIPDKILSSNCSAIKEMGLIKKRKEELQCPSKYPLAKLYHSIIQNKTEHEIKRMFSALSNDDKDLIFEYVCYSRPSVTFDLQSVTVDLQWGEHHVFDDMDNFCSAVHWAIGAKCNRLSIETQEQVYHNVCKLSVNRYSAPENWYSNLREEENAILLADAISMLDAHGKDEE